MADAEEVDRLQAPTPQCIFQRQHNRIATLVDGKLGRYFNTGGPRSFFGLFVARTDSTDRVEMIANANALKMEIVNIKWIPLKYRYLPIRDARTKDLSDAKRLGQRNSAGEVARGMH